MIAIAIAVVRCRSAPAFVKDAPRDTSENGDSLATCGRLEVENRDRDAVKLRVA